MYFFTIITKHKNTTFFLNYLYFISIESIITTFTSALYTAGSYIWIYHTSYMLDHTLNENK